MLDTLKKITMSCRKVFIRHLPIIHSFHKSGSSRLEACRDDNFLLNSAVKGFTLIELLVVVLIIGILASVALPQYQKAVIRSRYATLKNLTKALANAQEIYYMANGAYAQSIDELDIGLPDGQDPASSTASRYYYTWGYCGFGGAEEVQCRDNKANMLYQMRLQHHSIPRVSNTRACVVFNSQDLTDMRNQVCKAETGAETGYIAGDYTLWEYKN